MKVIYTLLFSLVLVLPSFATDYIQQYIVPNKVVQFDSRYFTGIDGFFSTQNLVSQQQTEERLLNLEKQLEILTKLLESINSKLGKTNEPTNDNAGVQPNVPNSGGNNDDSDANNGVDTTTPTSPVNPSGEPSELDIAAYNIFSTKCATCHGKKENNDGGLQLVDKETESLFYQNLVTRVNIFDRVNRVGLAERGLTAMPKGNNPLLDDEVEILRLWMIEEANKEK